MKKGIKIIMVQNLEIYLPKDGLRVKSTGSAFLENKI